MRLQSEQVFLYFGKTTRPIILIVLLQKDDSSWQCLVMAHIQLTPLERNINVKGECGIVTDTFMKKFNDSLL